MGKKRWTTLWKEVLKWESKELRLFFLGNREPLKILSRELAIKIII